MTSRIIAVAGIAAITMASAMTSAAEARDQIRIVGSSTVFPFSTTVAEQFGKISDFKTPVVESTGSGGGFKLFCSGLGTEHPDMTNSSRQIKQSEVDRCAKNGVVDITEVKVGFDGIVIANSKAAPQQTLTLRQIYLALAKDVPNDADGATLIPNPHRNWSDIDPSLPDRPIEVLGPPPTSGTRDAFAELVLEGGCRRYPGIKAMMKVDKERYKAVCHAIREDGAYVEAGENDVLIVQKLVANANAFGIFGFSFLDQNTDRIQGSLINQVEPTFETISEGAYPISRPLYFYVKDAHVGVIPGMVEFISAFANDRAWGPDGYLADKGLIPLSDDARAQERRRAIDLAPLTM